MQEIEDYDFYNSSLSSVEEKALLSNTAEIACNDRNDSKDSEEKNGQTSQVAKSNIRLSCLGAVMAVVSSLCFSICSFIVKYLKNVDPFELSTVRFTGILLPTAIIVLWVNENPLGPKEKRGLLVLRAVCGAMSLMMQFYAFRHMPLADASVIVFSAPVFVTIFARIFLKEHFGIFNVLMILLTICGVTLITKPPFLFGARGYELGYSEGTLSGVIAAFLGTISNANIYVVLRYLKEVHYSVVMFTFAVIAIVMSSAATLLIGEVSSSLSTNEYLLIVLIAVFSFGGQILLTKALQIEQAGPVSIYRSSDIVFAFIWQIIFFHEIPNIFSICGALLVTTSVILTALNKWFMTSQNVSIYEKGSRCLQCC